MEDPLSERKRIRATEAAEKAERVWPPTKRIIKPVGYEDAVVFLSKKGRIDCEDSIEILNEFAVQPELFKVGSVRERLTKIFTRFPKDFFVVTSYPYFV